MCQVSLRTAAGNRKVNAHILTILHFGSTWPRLWLVPCAAPVGDVLLLWKPSQNSTSLPQQSLLPIKWHKMHSLMDHNDCRWAKEITYWKPKIYYSCCYNAYVLYASDQTAQIKAFFMQSNFPAASWKGTKFWSNEKLKEDWALFSLFLRQMLDISSNISAVHNKVYFSQSSIMR